MNPINRQEELLTNAGWVRRTKILMCGLFILTFSGAHMLGIIRFPLALFIFVNVLQVTVNLPHHSYLRRWKNPERVFTITSVADVMIITVAAYTLGDLGKFLALILYPVVFIFAGVVMQARKTFYFANFSFFCMAALTVLELTGTIPPVRTMMLDVGGNHRLLILLITFPIYNFLAYFVWFLCRLMHKREAQLVHSVFHDELTGLPSRELFNERLRQAVARIELARSENREYSDVAVMFLDLDRFKRINNAFGHAAGDKLLVEAARRLESCVKTIDTVSHMGGDEFTILLSDLKDVSVPARVAERIQEAFSLPFVLFGHEAFTSVSMGITVTGPEYRDAENLLRDAHAAMYQAKTRGKARYEVFDAQMRLPVLARMDLEADLRRAVEREEFCLYYQPIVALSSGRLAGFEALIRWRHPRQGIVMPNDFIPIAEETGLVVPMGWWALKAACRELHRWQTVFKTAGPLAVSVNFSAKQFKEKDLNGEVIRALEETRADPALLKFEITESVLIENAEMTIAQINGLRDLSVQLYLDDFGTGYSSLSYLRRFNVEKLKIDRSFITRMDRSGKDMELARSIVLLAHGLKMEVIAEGVETTAQLAFLKRMGCDYGQGYYFSKPMDAESTEAYITESLRISAR